LEILEIQTNKNNPEREKRKKGKRVLGQRHSTYDEKLKLKRKKEERYTTRKRLKTNK
jgi:hypothetical protein